MNTDTFSNIVLAKQSAPRQNSGRARRQSSDHNGTSSKNVPIQPLTKRNAWKSLAAHSKEIKKLHLRKLFAQDAKRGERFTAEAAGLFLDYSKNRITDKTLELLLQLAAESGLREKINAIGKALAQRIVPELESVTEPKLNHDSSTNGLIRRYREIRRTA
jgi:hypothetical protein